MIVAVPQAVPPRRAHRVAAVRSLGPAEERDVAPGVPSPAVPPGAGKPEAVDALLCCVDLDALETRALLQEGSPTTEAINVASPPMEDVLH